MSEKHASNAPHTGQAAELWRELCECRRRLADAEAARDAQQSACADALRVVKALSADVEEVGAQRDALLKQLPDGMKHCTILFRTCKLGHGWLTAANWVQHGCPTCERDALRSLAGELAEALASSAASYGGTRSDDALLERARELLK